MDSLGDEIEDAFRQVPVRIDEGHALAFPDIGDNHVEKKGRFSGPGLSDDVHVGASVLLFDPEYLPDVAVIGDGKGGDGFGIVFACFSHTSILWAMASGQKTGRFAPGQKIALPERAI